MARESAIYKARIGGEAMLMSAPTAMGEPKKAGRGQDIFDPPEVEVEKRIYRRSDGSVFIPNMWVLSALKKEAGNFPHPARKRQRIGPMVFGGIRINPIEIPLKYKEMTVDKRTVVMKATKGRILRHRPCFHDWEVEFEVSTTMPDLFTPQLVYDILRDAGRYQGIGDFRPMFGTFEVLDFTAGDKKIKTT